jgi:catechol 1,2-dioxygenase
MFHKSGFKTQFSQVYSSDDPNLETDVQFAVTQALVGQYVLHAAAEPAPSGDVSGTWYSLAHHFVLEPGEAKLPPPPITGKASGTRPAPEILKRRP